MTRLHRVRWSLVAAAAVVASLGMHTCNQYGIGSFFLYFRAPLLAQLSLPEAVALDLRVSPLVADESLVVRLDGVEIPPGELAAGADGITALLEGLSEGSHQLRADAELRLFFFLRIPILALTSFEIADLPHPDECELLNGAECLLPYPSSRFLDDVGAETVTGYRTNFPAVGMPTLVGDPIDPTPGNRFDGFSPTAQVLMNFPQGVDLAASNAPVLLHPLCCGQSDATPYVGVRTQDARSLDPDSPTVLLDADTGERVLHWVELDARASDPARQILFLRPAEALVPGHRYIVAVRGLVDPDGEPVEPEPAFRALRNGAPSTIPALEARREAMHEIFLRLRSAGVSRWNLQLAFDFVVRSEEQLTHEMLFMRDDALAFVDALAPNDVSGFVLDNAFNAANTFDCATPGQATWRIVRGTFAGPYYLTASIDDNNAVPFLEVDADGTPVRTGVHPFVFDIAVPCAVHGGEPGYPLLLGHGLFGRGRDMVAGYAAGAFFGEPDVPFIAGASDWRGLSSPDLGWLVNKVIGTAALGNQLNNFRALPARLQQGQVNALVLAHMMKTGFFNRLPVFQRTPGDPSTGVFSTPAPEAFYFGVSLGGIMGLFHAGLSGEIDTYNIDVGAINFSLLLQRSTQFAVFDALLAGIGLTDPMQFALGLGLQHEQWVSGEPAAYARHVTGANAPPLPGATPKKILMTVAWLDKQVSNQASEIAARTLRIPQLVGSLQAQLEGIPDEDAGALGLESAYVIYDTGSFDVFDPAYDAVIPPLANRIPSSVCDPHGLPRLSIPASIDQLAAFLRPGGAIFNFCDGPCDAGSAIERPGGAAPEALCNPL